MLDSLARSLVRSGSPAVMGWAAPVLDNEATLFAANLYLRLAQGERLAHALAYARFELVNSQYLPAGPDGRPRSDDWHLARLYLNRTGGGALATAGGPKRFLEQGRAFKAFLNAKEGQVRVAGELEFVGRRRQVQEVLRELRAPAGQRKAGVVIRGIGRQGKSSLAHRVAQRLEPTHKAVVVHGAYDATAILRAFAGQIGSPKVTEITDRWMSQVRDDPTRLQPALLEILDGPCSQNSGNGQADRPALLVIDDFEQALDGRESGDHVVKTHLIDSIQSVLRAFNNTSGNSRLLFTWRFRFTLPVDGADLAGRLYDIELPPMNERESRKQALARMRLDEADRQLTESGALGLLGRIVATARGNPGLQDVLFSLALESPDKCSACLDQMDEYIKSGKVPTNDEVRELFERLAFEGVLDLLKPDEKQLLRTMRLFDLPVPESVALLVAQEQVQEGAAGRIRRLRSLGLLESYDDPRLAESDLAVNKLVAPLVGEALTPDEEGALAAAHAEPLLEAWGGATGSKTRDYLQDVELTRLGLLGRRANVVAAAAADALHFLEQQFEYEVAAGWARAVTALLEEEGVEPSVELRRIAGERLGQVGDTDAGDALLERAAERAEDPASADAEARGAVFLSFARSLVQRGELDRAHGYFQKAMELASDKRSRAVTLGDIARIRAGKGEVEEALRLHEEELKVYEGLGDKRSRAVTLGDIARIRAGKGEVDEALRLHEERLGIFEGLGDKRSRSVTLQDLAGLDLQMERPQEAFGRLVEAYRIVQEINALDGICAIGMDLGQLLCMAGHAEQGLAVLERSRQGFERMGWTAQANQPGRGPDRTILERRIDGCRGGLGGFPDRRRT